MPILAVAILVSWKVRLCSFGMHETMVKSIIDGCCERKRRLENVWSDRWLAARFDSLERKVFSSNSTADSLRHVESLVKTKRHAEPLKKYIWIFTAFESTRLPDWKIEIQTGNYKKLKKKKFQRIATRNKSTRRLRRSMELSIKSSGLHTLYSDRRKSSYAACG